MGRLTGKSDFHDLCEMHSTPEEIIRDFEIYPDVNSIVPYHITSEKDLIAFYPYIIAVQTYSDGKGQVYLSRTNYIDEKENGELMWMLNSVKQYNRKCINKHQEFNDKEAWNLICWNMQEDPQDYEIELIKRVKEKGIHATTEDIHIPRYDESRDEWYKMMVDGGWSEDVAYRWVYGWKRWTRRNKATDESNS